MRVGVNVSKGRVGDARAWGCPRLGVMGGSGCLGSS